MKFVCEFGAPIGDDTANDDELGAADVGADALPIGIEKRSGSEAGEVPRNSFAWCTAEICWG